MVAAALLLLASCSGSDGDDAKSKDDKSKSTTTTVAGAKTNAAAFVDVVECEPSSGNGTSSGTIENQGTEAAAYELTIGFFDDAGKQLATASTTTAEAEPGATVDWNLSAPGVGDIASSDLNCKTVSVKATGSSGASTTVVAKGDDEFPCDLVAAAEMAKITGNPLDGDAQSGETTENDKSWTAHSCVWTGIGASDAQEVTIAVSRPADFASGESQCPPPLGTTTAVSGVGNAATWNWTDPGTAQKVGELRVCSTAAFIAVRASGPGAEAAQKKVAIDVATAALSKL